MAQEHDGGSGQGAVELDARTAPREATPATPATPATTSATATDELRQRMRLRLAINAHRVHAHAHDSAPASDHDRRPPSTLTGPSTGPSTDDSALEGGRVAPGPEPGDVNHMVWNSVLQSLATGSQPVVPAADPTPWPPLAQTPPPSYEPQPLYSPPSISFETGQRSLAELLAAAATASLTNPRRDLVGPAANAALVAEASAAAPVIVPAPEPIAPEPIVVEPAVVEPVVVEPLIPSMIVPSIPVLGQPSRAAVPARPAAALVDHGSPAAMNTAIATKGRTKGKAKGQGPTRSANKHKRRPFRAFFAIILVAAILGSAAYGGWYQFLRNKVTWAADVAPIAADVERALNQQFTASVSIETLAAAEYDVKLGLAVLADSYSNSPTDVVGGLTALRAVGVVGPATDPAAIGHVVAAVRPSFYERTTSTIYRVDGTTAFFQRSLANSLAVALIDQRVAWSTGFGALTDAQRIAVIANVGELASHAVDTIALEHPIDTTAAASELAGRGQAAGLSGDQVPIVAALSIAAGYGGGAARPAPVAADPLATFAVPVDDAAVLDPVRDVTAPAVVVPAVVTSDGLPARTLGMQFWYAALIPSLGVDAARGAALAWAGDSSTVSLVNGNFACISANIATFDEAGQAALGGAMMQWAQSRPASSAATVSTQPGNVIAVSMCEPAEGATTAVATMDVGAIYSRARFEAAVASALTASGLPPTPKAWGCAALASRGGSLAGYTAGTVDPAVIEEMTAVIQFCSVP